MLYVAAKPTYANPLNRTVLPSYTLNSAGTQLQLIYDTFAHDKYHDTADHFPLDAVLGQTVHCRTFDERAFEHADIKEAKGTTVSLIWVLRLELRVPETASLISRGRRHNTQRSYLCLT